MLRAGVGRMVEVCEMKLGFAVCGQCSQYDSNMCWPCTVAEDNISHFAFAPGIGKGPY